MFKTHTGRLPEKLEDLVINPRVAGWSGPYWTSTVGEVKMVDFWGRPLRYRTNGKEFSIRSAGPDGKMDTDDDMSDGADM